MTNMRYAIAEAIQGFVCLTGLQRIALVPEARTQRGTSLGFKCPICNHILGRSPQVPSWPPRVLAQVLDVVILGMGAVKGNL